MFFKEVMMTRWAITLILLLSFGIAGCEEQTKEAEERGKVPKAIVDKAKKTADDAAAKMQERLSQMEQKGE